MRAARMLTPSAIAIAPTEAQKAESLHGLRRAVRLGRALAYWLLRPHLVRPWQLLRGGQPLLEDLAELRRLQVVGGRALMTTGASPYRLLVDPAAKEIRAVVTTRSTTGSGALDEIPRDLAGATSFQLDLADRWFVPIDRPDRRAMRLEALSAVMRTSPEAGRRLIRGSKPWCTVAWWADHG